jgi:Protein of unknown function (DUF3443)
MIRRTLLICTAAGSITGAIAGLFMSDMSAPVAGAATKSVVVPLSVAGAVGTQGGASPIVEVSVGTAKPVPVILDTGSAGLHIFDDAVDGTAGGGVNVTSRSSNITYAGGHRFTGVVASAVVAIGSQATAGPVAFSLVKSASCIASKPTCKAAGGIAGFEARTGAHGILGIGMQRSRGPVTSPILAMPGALGARWSVHLRGAAGTLVLGAQVPSSATTAVTFKMNSLGLIGRRTLWNDSALPFCTTIGRTRACTKGLFDTGTPAFQVSGPVLGALPATAASGQVHSGLPVSVVQRGALTPFWKFTTGTDKSQNLVRIKAALRPYVNTGVQAFYAFTIHYDDQQGTIALSR